MCDFYKKMNYLFFNLGKVFLFSSVIVFVMAIISLLIFLIFPHQIITSQDISKEIIAITKTITELNRNTFPKLKNK
jgi:uncharacterized membrane protein